MKRYSHSPLLYWWPIWLSSLGLGLWTLLAGSEATLTDETIRILTSSVPGFVFGALLLLVSVVTTVRMKGLLSVILLLSALLLIIATAWAGVLDDVARLIPALSTHLTAGFYLSFGVGLFIVWALTVFIFDRLVY